MSEPQNGSLSGDEALTAFVTAIEAAMSAHRGREHVLSPRDFALARSWFEAGVPLASALVGIDLAFAADPKASSLAFCRRRVEDLAAGTRRAAGPPHEVERVSLPELAAMLDGLRERLLELPGRVGALPLAHLDEVRGLVAVATRPNWDYLRERLRAIDELVSAAAVEALPAAALETVRAEANRAAERHRGRVAERALEEAAERLVRQRARERLHLPRVGID